MAITLFALFGLLFLFRVVFRKRMLKDVSDEAAKQAFKFKEFLKMAYPAVLIYSILYLFFLLSVVFFYGGFGNLNGVLTGINSGDNRMEASDWIPGLLAVFVAIWLILHVIDMDCRSRNKPFATFLKAVNTNTGVTKWNFYILGISLVMLILAIIVIIVTGNQYYICLPLFIAVTIAMFVNIFYGGSDADWYVKKPSQIHWKPSGESNKVRIKAGTQDDGTSGTDVVPEGKTPVEIEFKWNLNDKWGIPPDDSNVVKVTLYKEDWDEPDPELRKKNPFYGISDDSSEPNWLSAVGNGIVNSAPIVLQGPDSDTNHSEQNAMDSIVSSAMDIADKYNLADFEIPELLLSFSQSIEYKEDQLSDPIKQFNIVKDGLEHLEYFRFAAETLYDRQGDCDCKSILAYKLFKTLGIDVKLVDVCDKGSSTPSHAAIIINDKTNRHPKCAKYPEFTYCEATGEGWRIGIIPENIDENSIRVIA